MSPFVIVTIDNGMTPVCVVNVVDGFGKVACFHKLSCTASYGWFNFFVPLAAKNHLTCSKVCQSVNTDFHLNFLV